MSPIVEISSAICKGQHYLFGDKEREHAGGRNAYDFGGRILGGWYWTTIDQRSEDDRVPSPYVYCGGDPINRVDRDGKWSIEIHLEKDRNISGYGVAILYSRNKEELFRFMVRAEGINGRDRMKRNADTPLGRYSIPKNAWIIPNARTSKKDIESYVQYPRLIMIGESGEIIEYGRDLIRMHGGRQEVYNEETKQWEPLDNPELKKTQGCIRAYDIDMRALKAIVDEIETLDKYENPEFVNIEDDLEEFKNDDAYDYK